MQQKWCHDLVSCATLKENCVVTVVHKNHTTEVQAFIDCLELLFNRSAVLSYFTIEVALTFCLPTSG